VRNRGLSLSTSGDLTIPEIERYAESWQDDSDSRQLSPQTIAFRAIVVRNLLWYLRATDRQQCGKPEVRAFLAYLNRGHEEPGGRWGNPRLTEPPKSATAASYFRALRTMFRFFIAEGYLDESPMETLRAPIDRADQVQPFTEDQIEKLIGAARQTRNARRDEAIVLFLLDNGCRASEACSIILADLDLVGRSVMVEGKGAKKRSIPFGRSTLRALRAYLAEREWDPAAPLFLAEVGRYGGDPLTRSGLQQIIERLGRAAGIETVRASPHTFRHTFAIMFLRNDGDTFALQEILGHTSLAMVRRYVKLAQADIHRQHRASSPVDRLRKRK
jgi:integrase/recombinase XerD